MSPLVGSEAHPTPNATSKPTGRIQRKGYSIEAFRRMRSSFNARHHSVCGAVWKLSAKLRVWFFAIVLRQERRGGQDRQESCFLFDLLAFLASWRAWRFNFTRVG